MFKVCRCSRKVMMTTLTADFPQQRLGSCLGLRQQQNEKWGENCANLLLQQHLICEHNRFGSIG